MITINRATVNDADLLAQIGKKSFIESHGISAPKADMDTYVSLKLNVLTFTEELLDSKNHFFIIRYHTTPAGYSKIIFNHPHDSIKLKNVCKLERMYVLQEFHNVTLGLELFNFNRKASVQNRQGGMWLYVWTENLKALNFYKKAGFEIIATHNFEISNTHSNPNYQMLLTF